VTRFHLIRHALVEARARRIHYGTLDVDLCAPTRAAQRPLYAALAARLPRRAHWVVSPLTRTRRTAEAIFAAGYPEGDLAVEPGLNEQHIGSWQGLPHADLAGKLRLPAHAFWPMAEDETPPCGESMVAVVARVGVTLERLAREHPGREIVAVTHGGAIRAAVAHALSIGAEPALRLSIDNLSRTVLERHDAGWAVVRINEPFETKGSVPA